MIDQKIIDELFEALKGFMEADCVKARWNGEQTVRNDQYDKCRQCVLSGSCIPDSSDICSRIMTTFFKMERVKNITLEDFVVELKAAEEQRKREMEMWQTLKAPIEPPHYTVSATAFANPARINVRELRPEDLVQAYTATVEANVPEPLNQEIQDYLRPNEAPRRR